MINFGETNLKFKNQKLMKKLNFSTSYSQLDKM